MPTQACSHRRRNAKRSRRSVRAQCKLTVKWTVPVSRLSDQLEHRRFGQGQLLRSIPVRLRPQFGVGPNAHTNPHGDSYPNGNLYADHHEHTNPDIYTYIHANEYSYGNFYLYANSNLHRYTFSHTDSSASSDHCCGGL